MIRKRLRTLGGATFLTLAAALLFACGKDRPETPTVVVLMTACNQGEVSPCG